MEVLNLVTTPRPFFEDQVRILERKGVTSTTITVPGRGSTQDSRSFIDYVKFYQPTIRHSLRDYDIIHANYGLTGPFALAQPRRPVVLTLWGSDLAGKYSRISRICARLSDETIVMSEEMRSDLWHTAHVIPHGVDMEKFQPIDQSSALDMIGWNPDSRHVLFPYEPSRPVKNFSLAERVVGQVREEVNIPVELSPIYGVPHEEIPKYMNAADALLLTSQREGFPNSVKEAMACNLPVVSTDVGGLRHRLSNVSNSYVGTTEQELIEYLSSVIKSGQRSDGRNHVDDLGLDQMAEDILSVYRRALS